jgi:hypothetical protein
MDEEIFLQIVVPLLEMNSTSLIAISTLPPDAKNFFNDLLVLRDAGGELLFNVQEVKLACEECIKKKKPAECRHMQSLAPPWKDPNRMDFVSLLYGERDDLMARETLGVAGEDRNKAFLSEQVESMFKRTIKLRKGQIRAVFMSYDPNGGGDSELSLITVTWYRGQCVLLGADAQRARGSDEVEAILLLHYKRIRQQFPDAWVIFIGESNLGHEASWAANCLAKKATRFYALSEKTRMGVITTAERKQAYVSTLLQLLAIQAICINDKVFTDTKGVKKLERQLLAFKKIKKDRAYGLSSVMFSGKGSGNDDLAMAMLIGTHFSNKFIKKELSVNYRSMGL